MKPFDRIVVATDFGPSSRNGIDLAVDLATHYGAELVLAHVVEPFIPPYPVDPAAMIAAVDETSVETAAKRELLSELMRVQGSLPAAASELLHGNPAAELIRFAEETNASVLVLGTHGRSGPSRWLMGSVAEKVVRGAHVPVLTVRGEEGTRAAA